MKIKNILLGALLAVFLAGTAFAGEPKDGNRPERFPRFHERMEKKVNEMFDKLNLTAEQKSKIEENRKNNREQRKALMEKMRTLREAMKSELMKADLNMEQLKSVHAQIKALQSTMADNRLESILAVRKILTPEQFSKFISEMQEHKFGGRFNKDSDKEEK